MDVHRFGLSIWTPPPLCRMDWHGLESLRKICKAHPSAKLACMISPDLVAIGHVNSNSHFGRVLHEMITFSILGCVCSRRVRCAARVSRASRTVYWASIIR